MKDVTQDPKWNIAPIKCRVIKKIVKIFAMLKLQKEDSNFCQREGKIQENRTCNSFHLLFCILWNRANCNTIAGWRPLSHRTKYIFVAHDTIKHLRQFAMLSLDEWYFEAITLLVWA